MITSIVSFLPELLKLIPWLGMIGAALFAYLTHQKAQVTKAQADAKVSAAASTVAQVQADTAATNTVVAQTTQTAVQNAADTAAAVSTQSDDAVRQELQNEFGRKE